MTETENPIWAAFDFDGTLTRKDSLLPFLQQVLGNARLTSVLALQSPWLAAYAMGWLANDRTKERLLRHTLGGMQRDELLQQGRRYAEHTLPGLLRSSILQRLRQHQELGHTCVLVTASLTLYTEPWGRAAGFAQVIGSEMTYDDRGCATGALSGGNCYGAEKEKRLRAILPANARLYAYGDSLGDREMLAMADVPCLIGKHKACGQRPLPPLT